MTAPAPEPGVAAAPPGRDVHVVVPAGIDDPASPSGGDVYDRRMCAGLAAAGRAVHEHAVPGAWPDPDPAARDRLDTALTAVPDGADVLLDGLVICGAPEVLARHAGRVRAIVLVHLPLGDECGIGAAVAQARRARERAALHLVSAVVTTSPWTARRVVEQHGLPPALVHVVAPGVDPAPSTPPRERGTRLLAVGALTPTKGHDLLVEALARCTELDWTLRLVGPHERDREHAGAVRAAIARHGLGGRVTVTGPLTGPDLDLAYADADLLVLPSRTESYGMVVTEALARAVPVLATAAGGVPDTLGRDRTHGVPGLLVGPGDPEALALGLRTWLTVPDVRGAARSAARGRRTELAGWPEAVRRLERVLA
ncbi:glycosyltransferase family 4 protein [Pseudonocardia parietis]|uniref:Glycosyltransferase involved in cell wall biosynthesis n=1 Tax=Pseudonocardia parietis TaxID=570936 RepID=A0ABS4VYI4_9PSEU|nr:glycosyltransferase family 4 protein [Pseudonocardia parietis]MBP2368974.1 glycosyltransferase involved in cell wall biosynthesis [Pseudonocardia parietis]